MILERLLKTVAYLRHQNPPGMQPFETPAVHAEVSAQAMRAARQIRGDTRPPAIMIFGVLPRSGTVHVGELLGLHPEVAAYPNDIWEIPFLDQMPHLAAFQTGFFARYKQNRQRMPDNEFLPLFGSAFIAYLHSFAPAGKRILVKEPRVHYLGYIPAVFPFENLLLLLRDGRDVVQSSLRTWPTMRFEDLCTRWARSAKAMLDFHTSYEQREPSCHLVRFEDVLDNPGGFVRESCRTFKLDDSVYPFDKQKDVTIIGSSTISEEGKVSWFDHVKPPAGFRPKGHWHNWTRNQKKRFKKLAGRALIESGYASDMNW